MNDNQEYGMKDFVTIVLILGGIFAFLSIVVGNLSFWIDPPVEKECLKWEHRSVTIEKYNGRVVDVQKYQPHCVRWRNN